MGEKLHSSLPLIPMRRKNGSVVFAHPQEAEGIVFHYSKESLEKAGEGDIEEGIRIIAIGLARMFETHDLPEQPSVELLRKRAGTLVQAESWGDRYLFATRNRKYALALTSEEIMDLTSLDTEEGKTLLELYLSDLCAASNEAAIAKKPTPEELREWRAKQA